MRSLANAYPITPCVSYARRPPASRLLGQRKTRHKRRFGAASEMSCKGKRPILLFDIMDTVVKDPFYKHMPEFFNMDFKHMCALKHPTNWVRFEKAEITEEELFDNFWRSDVNGPAFDGPSLREYMASKYELLDGMPQLLEKLAAAGYELHAFSNYPVWWQAVEARLGISRFLSWTFLSCQGPTAGRRKPDPETFQAAAAHLHVNTMSDLLLVDDQQGNVEAARQQGLQAIRFLTSNQLEEDLRAVGLEF